MDEKNVPYIILFTSIICIAMQKKVSNVSDNCGHQHVKKKQKRGKNVSFLLLTSYRICLGVHPRN
jgi:hypothetical protein